jgi:hypothetical protein
VRCGGGRALSQVTVRERPDSEKEGGDSGERGGRAGGAMRWQRRRRLVVVWAVVVGP